MKGLKEDPEVRFWMLVQCVASGCWEWQGSYGPTGYGQFNAGGGRMVRAHRYSFILFFGETDLCVLHRCDNRICVNPNHLFAGTRKDNSQDAIAKDRLSRGSRHPDSKLNESDVVQIHKQYGQGVYQKDIAKSFGVSQSTISTICSGRWWKHVFPLEKVRM